MPLDGAGHGRAAESEGGLSGMPAVWERIVERLHTQLDRVSHASGRRQTRQRAIRRGAPRRVVVVCYGNICRSPYAAAALRRRLAIAGAPSIQIESAGLFGAGRPANRQAAAAAGHRAISLEGHQSRLFRRSDSEGDSLILVMTRSQKRELIREFAVESRRIELLGDFDTEDPPYREILDPYGKSDEEFDRVFSQIDRSVDGLLQVWRSQGAPQGGPESSIGA